MSSNVPKIKLNDGNQMPLLGFGTYEAPKGETAQTVAWALETGYRHFDCADFYENEDEVGEAFEAAFKSGLCKREDIFVTTKVWPNWYSKGRPTKSIQRSLAYLKLDYVDLALVHWPTPFVDDDKNFYPVDKDDKILLNETLELSEVWKEFEEIKAKGLAKSIGVSNFNSKQVQHLIDTSNTVPAVNQVESHPYLNQQKLLEWARSKGIALTAYSPLARSGTQEKKNTTSPLQDATIGAIAEAHRVSPAQVCIRWQIQRGVAVIPKSASKSRIQSNFNVLGFELTNAEIEQMNGLNQNCRNNQWRQFGIDISKNWPFAIEF